MAITLSDQVKYYGHYVVNNKIFLNKIDAFVESGQNLSSVKFHYNDDVFSKYDWTHDPDPSQGVESFYRQRAQQIRDKYDYVIILYSGGPDSTNVLNSFVKNNIPVDEVVNMNSYSRTGVVKDTIHNADYVFNVEPYLKQLMAEYNLQTRITILDEIDLVKQHWAHHYQTDNWESLFGAVPAPSMFITKQVWIRYVPHLWKMILDNKKVGIVIGADKTPLRLINGKYAVNFPDTLVTDTSLLNSHDSDLQHLNLQELFYHSPECPELIIKQAHMLKQFVEHTTNSKLFTTPAEIKQLELNDQRLSHCCQSKKFAGHLNYELYHKILYPAWKAQVVTPKTSLLVTRPADNWWIHDFDAKDKKIFLHGLLKTRQRAPQGVDFMTTGLPISFSKPYFLE